MKLKNRFLALAVAFIFTAINTVAVYANQSSVEIVDAAEKTAVLTDAKKGTSIIVADFSMEEDLDSETEGVQTYDDLSDTAKKALLKNRTKYAKQITANGDFVFKLPAFSVYTVFINEAGTVEDYQLTMHNPDFVTNHQTAEDSAAIYENFDLAYGYMKGELVIYYSLDEDGMEAVSGILFDRRASDGDVDEIVDRAELISKLYKYSMLDSADERVAAFEADEDINYTSLTDYEDYELQEDEFKSDVVDRFLGFEKLDGSDKFDNAFSQSMFLEKVECATLAPEIDVLVSEAKSKFGISTPKYDSLGEDTSAVSLEMAGKNLNTVAEFVNTLEGLISVDDDDDEDDSDDSDTGKNKVTGGGGGGGNSIISDVKVPIVENEIVSNDNSSDDLLYSDVETDRWSYEPIYILSKRGVLSGDGTGVFRPEDGVTREEFVKIVISTFDMVNDSIECEFADVDISRWSYKYIASAKKYGIVNGRTETEFCPTDMLTREEAAVILNNVIKFKSIPVKMNGANPEFTDKNDISDWSETAVEYLYKCGIINGYGDNSFAPKANITREQTAKLVYSLLKYLI